MQNKNKNPESVFVKKCFIVKKLRFESKKIIGIAFKPLCENFVWMEALAKSDIKHWSKTEYNYHFETKIDKLPKI